MHIAQITMAGTDTMAGKHTEPCSRRRSSRQAQYRLKITWQEHTPDVRAPALFCLSLPLIGSSGSCSCHDRLSCDLQSSAGFLLWDCDLQSVGRSAVALVRWSRRALLQRLPRLTPSSALLCAYLWFAVQRRLCCSTCRRWTPSSAALFHYWKCDLQIIVLLGSRKLSFQTPKTSPHHSYLLSVVWFECDVGCVIWSVWCQLCDVSCVILCVMSVVWCWVCDDVNCVIRVCDVGCVMLGVWC